jgi:hypothetical protein
VLLFLAGPAQQPPGWAGISLTRLGRSDSRLGRSDSRLGRSNSRLGRSTPAAQWAQAGLLLRATALRQAGVSSRLGSLPRTEAAQADTPGPGRNSPCRLAWSLRSIPIGLGWASSPQAGLNPSGPGFTPSGLYSSSGINSSILCQSWDALWLRLAHPPS